MTRVTIGGGGPEPLLGKELWNILITLEPVSKIKVISFIWEPINNEP